MSLISFVIPAYNQGRFVAQAIDSALAQTHRDVEVVVIDDGSTDDTADVLARYQRTPNVKTVRQPNAGLPVTRNRGLAAATGDQICFLDADDVLAPAYAETLTRALDADDQLAFVYSDVQWITEAGVPAGPYSVAGARRVLNGDIFASLMMGGYFPPHAALVRRAVLDRIGGFDPELGGNADYELWLRIAGAGETAAFVNERLAFYRVSDRSMSRNLDHMRHTRMAALERIARRYPERVAQALVSVQALTADLATANDWLSRQWNDAIRALEAEHGGGWSLLQHLPDAQLTGGASDALAVWDATIDGVTRRAIRLHPPATLAVTLPSGAPGRIVSAVAIHPEAWEKPETGVCQFAIVVDGREAVSVVLDPARRPADRRWIEIAIDVPASTAPHTLALETRALGVNYFCWALFRDVNFVTAAR